MADIEVEIRRLKEALGVKLDRELALALEIDPTAVAAWRRRGGVPKKYRSHIDNFDQAKSAFDDDLVPGLYKAYIFSMLQTILYKINEAVGYKGQEISEFESIFYGLRNSVIYDFLSAKMTNDMTKSQLDSVSRAVRQELDDMGVAEWVRRMTAFHLQVE